LLATVAAERGAAEADGEESELEASSPPERVAAWSDVLDEQPAATTPMASRPATAAE